MKPMTLSQVAAWTAGTLIAGEAGATIQRVATDSRGDLTGALFVPLVGEHFDGHDFLPQAFAHGAVAALTARATRVADHAVIAVDDTLGALQRLATRYRASLAPFLSIGVTGSNGKTTTKDFLASVLTPAYRVHATRGNLNNHIGVPLTVLETDPEDTAGIFEMGMNHFGEIAPLAAIAQPAVAVVTNIGTAHIEFLGSREGIALEKGRLIEAIPADGFVVLNADDPMTPALAARSAAPVVTAGLTGGDVRAEAIDGASFDLVAPGQPRVRIDLPVPGRHMIGNALLAAAVGCRLGLSSHTIADGLHTASLHSGRLQRLQVAGLQFLDDSYNANPDSMTAALRTLGESAAAGRRIAVLGRMGELGAHTAEGHHTVGRAAAAQPIDFLITMGDDDARLIHDAFGDPGRSHHCATHAETADWLRRHATADDLILLKGSRAAAMETILTILNSPTA